MTSEIRRKCGLDLLPEGMGEKRRALMTELFSPVSQGWWLFVALFLLTPAGKGRCCCPRHAFTGNGSQPCSARWRSHCPCIAIRWGGTSCCCLQRGRTGGSALWLCRSHCGIESQRGRCYTRFKKL